MRVCCLIHHSCLQKEVKVRVKVKVEATAEADQGVEVILTAGLEVDHILILHILGQDLGVEAEVEVTATVGLAVDHILIHHTHHDQDPVQDLFPFQEEEDHLAFLTEDELQGEL